MTKRFIPVLAACLFLMVGTAQAATSLAFPPPDTKGGKPLMQTLSGRATNRSFTAKPLSDKLLGDLLWAAYGVNRPNGKRTIPTAQNRQDLEIYVLRSDGAWLYDAPKHSLEQVSSSDLRNFLAGQGFVREAPVGLVYVTNTQKNSKELFAACIRVPPTRTWACSAPPWGCTMSSALPTTPKASLPPSASPNPSIS